MATDTIPTPNFFEKHREKIEFGGPDDCWLWVAGKSRAGYGVVGTSLKVCYAHRKSYEAENGDGSVDGLVVRHKCDTPACVNPAHLEIGTQADNMRDMMKRGRNRQPKGSANGSAKLTEADVAAIRAEYVRGSRVHGAVAVARRFKVCHTTIGSIVRREKWRHF